MTIPHNYPKSLPKNIREELLEEKSTKINHSDNEIAYVTAKINGISITLMIDTNVY